jgi:hypothetical protein
VIYAMIGVLVVRVFLVISDSLPDFGGKNRGAKR